jgi:hypothetical protein
MRTDYEFKKEVGQVVGGDSKTNSAQTRVDLHMHLEGWLRHEAGDRTSGATPVRPIDSSSCHAGSYGEVGANSAMCLNAPPDYMLASAPVASHRSAPVNRSTLLSLFAFGACIAAVGASAYSVAKSEASPQPHSPVVHALNCEYGGNRYSVGSVVMQADVRRLCVAAGTSRAAWQNAQSDHQL